MLSIAFVAFLYSYIVVGCGYFTTRAISHTLTFKNDFFSVVLTGTLVLTIYLNVVSFFLPTDYKTLALPFIISTITLYNTNSKLWLKNIAVNNFKLLWRGNHKIISLPLIIVVLLFAILPPYNTDSSGYHFLNIKWNEEFKIVPGLANLFCQFGYNSSFLVLSAAFSFTTLFGQSIYAINVVITLWFFCWLLKKYFHYNDYAKLIWIVLLFIFLRQFPINLSSPSADSLASILVFYILFTILESSYDNLHQHWKYLFIMACFAVIIKLSTLPLLLVGVIPFFLKRKNLTKRIKIFLNVLPFGVVIIIPWLIRNVVLTGYLIYPFPQLDIFSVDWKVPYDVAFADRLHISQATKMAGDNLLVVSKMALYDWVPLWLPNLWVDNAANCILIIAGMFSPVLFIVFRKKILNQFSVLLACFISYCGIIFWINTSPDIRFGYHFIIPALFFPLLYIAQQPRMNNLRFHYFGEKLYAVIFIAGCMHYAIIGYNYIKPYSIADVIIKPLKSNEYFKNNRLESFQFVYLNDSIKLFIHDAQHHSINAPLPSCSPYRNGIQLRGTNLQEGFRTQQ